MAELTRPLQYICRSCRSQIQKSPSHARSFATSSPRSRTVPSFQPTSSPELDALLLTYRHKIFTPWALAKTHRDLIYRPSRHQILLNDPGVTVTLSNDEEIKLQPLHPHDKPNKRTSLLRLSQLLAESNDPQRWNTLPPFLEGMHMSHEALPPFWLEQLTRKAAENGREGVIIRCAEMAKKTGLSLSNQSVTRQLMLGFHLRAANANFQGPELAKALKYVGQVALMLEDESHCGGHLRLDRGQVDMRSHPIVLAVQLEVAAADAIANHDGEDKTGLVASYGKKARAAMAMQKKQATPVDTDAASLHRQLEDMLPLWNGLKLAGRVKVSSDDKGHEDIHKGFHAMSKKVEDLRKKITAEANGRQRRCLTMYDQLSG